MNQVTVLTGCAGSGKTERLVADFRAALEHARIARRPWTTLWLAPNRRIQRETLRRIAAGAAGPCFSPNVLTFDRFAEKILEAAGRPASPVSPVMRRILLRRIVMSLLEQKQLRHFQAIAATPGFLDVVSRFISELKREEIWPQTFIDVCKQRGSESARRDLELGMVYKQYQEQLTAQNWYDNEGRFWLARAAIAGGTRRPFDNVKLLIVDGFTDFTQTQYEILRHLSGWIEQISISFPLEDPVTRTDLFVKPQAAIARIRSQLPHLRIERMSVPDGGQPVAGRGWCATHRVISEQLFSNPRALERSSAAVGLEIIAATGPRGEWEAIARRIKRLLVRQSETAAGPAITVRPQDIVIGLRATSASESLRLRDDLISAGLPVWCDAEPPMASIPIVKAVISLLHLELEDWSFDRLLTVLDSNFFRPLWPEFREGRAVRNVAAVLRHRQIHGGRELMLGVLKRHASTEASESNDLTDLTRSAAPLLLRLSRCLERLRHANTLEGWADSLAATAEDLGWTRPSASRPDRLDETEWRDLDLLQRNLRTAAEADKKTSENGLPRRLSLAEFTAELCDLVNHVNGVPVAEPEGCVKILDLEQVRSLDVPHLFLIGLTENSFPMNQSEDCLLSESERHDFNQRGIPLRHHSSEQSDEMLLFYSIVTRARRSLTLSYPEVNSQGQKVFPSPYVTALRDLFDADQVVTVREGQLNPVPLADQALTLTDLRLSAVQLAQDGQPGLYRTLLDFEPLQRICLNTLAACDVADHRFHQQGFTEYEGQLRVDENLNRLKQKFGANHQFSATEFESYARCPFQFWMSSVLRIGQVETPEEGTDHAARGTLLHEILAKLLNEGVMDDPARLHSRFVELLNGLLDRHRSETAFQKSLVKLEQRTLMQWAAAFVQQQSSYAEAIRELMTMGDSLPPEIPFGRLPETSRETAAVHPAVRFGSGDRAVNLRGRIDRVDIGNADGRPAYVVIDYKSGLVPTMKDSDLISGRTMQLALYLLAIKRLKLAGDAAIPFQMGYWGLRDKGFKHATGGLKLKRIESDKLHWLETLMDHLLPELADEIRSGRFVVENEDPDCTGRCPYRTACRVNQIRPLAGQLRKQSAPRIDPTETK